MGTYRKKPVVVEAIQFKRLADGGFAWSDITEFFGSKSGGTVWQAGGSRISIRTREGTMRADPDDWIIKGVAGEFYPCKPDIFLRTYEPAEAPA